MGLGLVGLKPDRTTPPSPRGSSWPRRTRTARRKRLGSCRGGSAPPRTGDARSAGWSSRCTTPDRIAGNTRWGGPGGALRPSRGSEGADRADRARPL